MCDNLTTSCLCDLGRVISPKPGFPRLSNIHNPAWKVKNKRGSKWKGLEEGPRVQTEGMTCDSWECCCHTDLFSQQLSMSLLSRARALQEDSVPSLLIQMACFWGRGGAEPDSGAAHMSFRPSTGKMVRQGMTALEWKSLLCDSAIG